MGQDDRSLNERLAAENAVRQLLEWMGEDIERDGLKMTPFRVIQTLLSMTIGYDQSPSDILSTCFDVPYDQMVVLRGTRFTSLCEHHLLPFTGTATIGYLPGKKVVGISKLSRLVDCFGRRLQVQERMTKQIADALEGHLQPVGAGVLIKAHHGCMGCRGVRQPETEMITSDLRGAMRDDPQARAEFLQLAMA